MNEAFRKEYLYIQKQYLDCKWYQFRKKRYLFYNIQFMKSLIKAGELSKITNK